MRFIRYEDISPQQLIGNAKNPRSDLGDLTELVESIAQNGIYQELTVVPHGEVSVYNPDDGSTKWKPGYMVIIGHRRLAAARKAGLETVPCKVVDMSEREQQTTMLTENVQRSDLTPLEEAKGIQMCLDLGIPEAEIAKEAGMSRTKIRTRKVLLKYDDDLVKKTFAAGATIQDYLAVEKIEDEKEREKILEKYAGTAEFTYKVNDAIQLQAERKAKQIIMNAVKEIAVPIPKDTKTWELDYIFGFYSRDLKEKSKADIEKDVAEKVIGYKRLPDQKLYYDDSHGSFVFYKDPDPKKYGKSEEEKERDDRIRRLSASFDVLTYKRAEFMRDLKKTYSPSNPHEARKKAFLYFFELLFSYNSGLNLKSETINPIFGSAIWRQRDKVIEFMADEFDNRPAYATLLAEFLMRESKVSRTYPFTYRAEYSSSNAKTLQEQYDWLAKFNYRMTENEKQLLNGTHPDYKKSE